MSLAERFKSKWKFAEAQGCWEWQAGKQAKGYGQIWANGENRKAHRVAYELFRGEIPEGLHCCHHCDNPSCVNPWHLFLGTNADNVADRHKKGRSSAPKGESHHGSKLTEDQVLAIREDTRSLRKIAAKYGVDFTTIGDIKRRKIWAHI